MALTHTQALDLLRSDDLIGLGMDADAVRRAMHPERVVSYLLEERLDCSRVTTGEGNSSVEIAEILARLDELVDAGASGIRIECISAGIKIEFAERILAAIRQHVPHITLRAFPAPELVAMADANHLPVREVILRLRDAGLDSISGEGASLFDGDAPPADFRVSVPEWIEVHRAAHKLGMRTTATMIFGAGEDAGQRVSYLEQVRQLQDETGGFAAFSARNASAGREWEEATAVEYLKVLAVSRVLLENIENVEADWMPQGLKVLQMALRFGCNDAGSVSTRNARGNASATTEEDLRRVIRGAGFEPVQRDALYRSMLIA